MDKYDPASSIGWLHHFHNVWPQEESKFHWIKYLFLEQNALKAAIEIASCSEERDELEEQLSVVLEEFDLQLESVETLDQANFVMKNLPFHDSDSI